MKNDMAKIPLAISISHIKKKPLRQVLCAIYIN